MNQSPSMLKSALIGGAAFGFLGALPMVGALNCACCSLIVAGGFLAAFLYSKECASAGLAFRPGNGALVGLLGSVFYALATAITGLFTQMIPGMSISEQVEQARERMESVGRSMPPGAMRFMEAVADAGPVLVLLGLFGINLVLGAIFSTVGGLIGGAVFKVEPPEAPPAATPGADA